MSGTDRVKPPAVVEQATQPFDVSPIKIQAELAEIKPNSDFTGHYFFPEDDENDEETVSETTESYYDNSNLPVSDIVLEIEEIKRNKATKDFLDDILESDSATESTTPFNLLPPDDMNIFKTGRSSMKKFLDEISEKQHKSFI